MLRSLAIISFSLSLTACVNQIQSKKSIDEKRLTPLYQEILAMDKKFFDAFNNCDMQTQRKILSDSIEFFHDQSGLDNSKESILEATEKNICNRVSRDLLEERMEVHAIPNYGAVQIGYHTFHNSENANPTSKAFKFIHVWKQTDGNWQIEKVISLH